MIDLRSDTVTKPTPAMREAMARAEVGDDVYGEDPTVNRLQERVAALLGKEAALFVPSGIMANQLAIRAHAGPGEEIVVEGSAHIVRYEQGAASALTGVHLHWVSGDRGLMTPEQVEAAIRPKDPYGLPAKLICLENTHNAGGGAIYPLETIARIRAVADAHGVPMHLDGARLFNAVVATGIPAADYARHFETVSVCLSKGLGAPVGSLVASDRHTIERLRRVRRMYGGGMRQTGILAAAGLHALEHHIGRLKEDHANARRLAELLATIPAVTVSPAQVETNIVIFRTAESAPPAPELVARLKAAGVLINAVGPRAFRAVTHLDVSAADIEEAGRIFARLLA
jgi:threonine aldolase